MVVYSKNRADANVEAYIRLDKVEIDYNIYKIYNHVYFKDFKYRLDNYGGVIVRNRGLDTEAIIDDFVREVFESEDFKTDNTTNKNTDQLDIASS